MPIYAYKCGSCGHAKDVLQKISDAPLSTCPACGEPAFTKQVTAAGFQLKGSGWYVTDFRGGSAGSGGSAEPGSAPSGASAGASAAGPASGAASGEAAASSPASGATASTASSSASAPAAASGSGSGSS